VGSSGTGCDLLDNVEEEGGVERELRVVFKDWEERGVEFWDE